MNKKRFFFLFLITLTLLTSCSEKDQPSAIGSNHQITSDLNPDEDDIKTSSINNEASINSGNIANDFFGKDYERDDPILITRQEEAELDCFHNNLKLTLHENEYIKKTIIDTILYIFNFDVDDDIFLATNIEASLEWFASYGYYEKGWSIKDEIDFQKKANDNTAGQEMVLHSIDANFMVKPHNSIEESILKISVPIYSDIVIYGDEGGTRKTYDFVFEKIGETYRVVGITLGA